ncbi:MAG TPA: HAD family hydrolase [Syntrophaceae bacterium]|nr:HAD family hydrolase [Syntrophaceae bacterium]
MNIAVFMDRDGTINEEVGYINHIDRFKLLPRAIDAIKLINHVGLKAVVVTNQSGPARGYYPEQLINEVHIKLTSILKEKQAYLDGIYYCCHHPHAVEEVYRKVCDCRKPNIGLLIQAARELNIDLKRSYVVGDRYLDIELAHNAGTKGILVLTGYGQGEVRYVGPKQRCKPVFIAKDLLDAVKWIAKDIKK